MSGAVGKWTCPADPVVSASRWSATCSIATWAAAGLPRSPITLTTRRSGRTSAVRRPTIGEKWMSYSRRRTIMGRNSRCSIPIAAVAAVVLGASILWCAPPSPATLTSGGYAYIGTLDHELRILDEDMEQRVGEIALGGIPRMAALSCDQTK